MTDERHDDSGTTPHEPTEPQNGTSSDTTASGRRTFTEEFQVSGERVVSKIKEVIREGNVRRITLKNDEGKTLIEIPLTLGVIGTALLPVWAGIGAIAALVANLTITVEKVAGPAQQAEAPSDAPAEAAGREITSG